MRIPAPIELLTRPGAAGEVIALVRSLQKLKVVFTCQGTVTSAVLQVAGSNCVLPVSLSIVTEAPVETHPLEAETVVWRDRAIAAGGTFADDSINIANNLIYRIRTAAFGSKIIYLLPFLGANLATARVPLRDLRGKGIATNYNFTDADFNQGAGLQGNGVDKRLDPGMVTFDLGDGLGQSLGNNNGGLGAWEMSSDVSAHGESALGTQRTAANETYSLYRSAAPAMRFYWEQKYAAVAEVRGRAHYYGQRENAASCSLFKSGSTVGGVQGTVGARVLEGLVISIFAMTNAGAGQVGITYSEYWSGRLGVAYMTSGDLTAPEIAAFHTLLQDYLITPTGR